LESYAGPPAPDFFYVLSIAVVRCFEEGEFDVIRLNYAMLTLIPKEPDVKHLKYRSISLLNCSLKIITWILTMRLNRVCERLISQNQIAFIKGRFILERVVCAHEVIHYVHKQNLSGLVLKLDYEKVLKLFLRWYSIVTR
jgi:hypothetical protein